MDEMLQLADRFEQQRPRLRSVAYRILGSLSDADDAVQDTWIRLQRTDASQIDNLDGWLTTVVSRVALNALRARTTRPETVSSPAGMPDPVVSRADGTAAPGPEDQALLAEAVGLAMVVVLDTMTPAERVAFVLHDVFGVPFPEVADVIGGSADAARQLGSRARRKMQATPTPDRGLAAQHQVVAAFFAAARSGNLDELVTVLHPDVVLRVDLGRPAGARGLQTVVGAAHVASRALSFASPERRVVPVLVNGAAGAVVVVGHQPVSVMSFVVTEGRIATIDVLADLERLIELDLMPLLSGD